MNLDSLTFDTSRGRDGRWTTVNPQFGIRVTRRSRLDAIFDCQREAFARFYEMDADRATARQAGDTRSGP